MSYCDDQYTKVAKPTASYTTVAKPVASYTKVAKPCLEPLAILTEDGVEILCEDGRIMVVEGAL
jgi:hypothetical protein